MSAVGAVCLTILGCSGWSKETREVTCASDEAYAAYREGLDQAYRFHPEEAFEALRRATELDPQFVMAQVRLAATARGLGRKDFADSVLAAAYQQREVASPVEALLVERTYALAQDDHERGMEIYHELVKLAPDNPWVLRLRAEEARRQQNFRQALVFYDRILETDPEAIEIHNLKGYMYLGLGDYEEAIRALQRYAYYAPDNANPHDSLGEAYLYEGKYELAMQEFVRALEIEPTFLWSATHLAQALGITGQFRRAEQTLDELRPVFEERDQLKWLHLEQLKLAYLAEDWPRTIAIAEAQLPLPDQLPAMDTEWGVWVHYARTMGYLEMGQLEEAQAALAKLTTFLDSFQKKTAIYGAFDSIFEINRAALRSRFARKRGNPSEGIDDLRKAIAASKMSPHELASFRHELAEALLATNRPAEAAEVAEELLEKIPTAPRMNLLAAKAYHEMGQREPALEHLRTYLEVMRFADEGNPRVAEATKLLQQMVPRS